MNKAHYSIRNRSNINSHLKKYLNELKKQERVYVKQETLHPDCSGRFPQICNSKFELTEVEVCSEKLKFCKACAYEINSRVAKQISKPSQKFYWRDNFKEQKTLKKDREQLPSQKEKGKYRPHQRSKQSKLVRKDPIA